MMKEIEHYVRRDVPPLTESDTVFDAAKRLSSESLTDLPVVGEDGRMKGIFGEKEVITSLFPTYLGELSDTTFVKTDFEDVAECARAAIDEPVSKKMRREFATLDEDFSAIHCAELFLHRRQGVIPLVRDQKPVALIRRSDLGRAIIEATAKDAAVSS